MEKWNKLKRYSKRVYNRFTHGEDANKGDIEFTTTVMTERKSIMWTIENVYMCPLKTGEYLESPTFCTGINEVTKWCLRFYPCGKGISLDTAPLFSPIKLNKAALFLYKISPSTQVQIEVGLYAKGLRGDDREYVELYTCGSGHVCKEPEEIGTDELIVADVTKGVKAESHLKILCRMIVGYLVEEDTGNDNKEIQSLSCSSALSSDFETFYDSGKFTDAILQVGKKQFPVHKAILAARSKVFFAMFEHDMKESATNTVNIEDVDPCIITNVLQHIYTGKIDGMNADKAILLFQVADKYSLTDLRNECTKILLENMSVKNVCRIAVLADIHTVSKLKDASIYFIRKYYSQIFERGEWVALTVDRPLLAGEIVKNVFTNYMTDCASLKRVS